ncbi:MAG: phosphate acyltransferase PlsX [Candidatus Pacebacteria bacterium]|nr:phosphate acyltransferase PlsX [Candidatus Paceibacterota bacterium]
MSKELSIALDVMGGDNAPDIVVAGADIARERYPDVRFLLVGPEPRITAMLASRPLLAKVSKIIHTDDEVSNTVKVGEALRKGRNSSMWLAIETVAKGEAQAVVSAGNTGALMAMAKLSLRPLKGIDRPAIATFLPSRRGETVVLDLGANMICDASNLVQFAMLGEVFARSLLGIPKPTIGLLNVGSEEMKGRDEVREAAAILRNSYLSEQFQGFIEGDDIMAGAVDVAVTDGFTGNAALKAAEGASKLFAHNLREAFKSSIWARIAFPLIGSALKKFKYRIDPRRYNGAIFLGLNGISIKSHGGTDDWGFANAIGVAVDLARHDFMDELRHEMTARAGTMVLPPETISESKAEGHTANHNGQKAPSPASANH